MKRIGSFVLVLWAAVVLGGVALAGPFAGGGSGGGGSGSGTVTDVSVTTANGVSGSVANSTTTPAISLTLGAITPSTVTTGTVTTSVINGTPTIATPTISGHPTIEGVTSTGATGTGNIVYSSSPTINTPTFVAPALGTPSSGTATNLTGTAASLTSGSATVLATPRAIAGHNFDGSAAITIACGDLSNGATGCSTATGTSGATIPLLNAANTWSAVQETDIATSANTSAAGGALVSTTAASAGNQQFSPQFRWRGFGWKTTATAASQPVDFIAEVRPVQGTTAPTGALFFSYQVNGGGYTDGPSINTSGTIVGKSSASATTPQLGAASGENIYVAATGGGTSVTLGANTATYFSTSGTVGATVRSDGMYAFSSSTTLPDTGPDTVSTRRAAATWQFGKIDSATPVAQTLAFQGSRGGTDTNIAGANATIQGSLGTGTAVPSTVAVSTAALGTASGTTQHTAIQREVIGATKVLTNNTVTTMVNVTDASNTAAMVIVEYGVEVFDGTNVQYEVGTVSCGVNNKGGVFSQNTCTKFGNTQGVTSGTLAVTWTITGANPALLQLNANSSLTPSAGYPRVTYTLKNVGSQAVAVQ